MKILKYLLVLAVMLVPLNFAQAGSTVIGPVTVTDLTFSATPLVAGTSVNIVGTGMTSILSAFLNPMNGTSGGSYAITPTTKSQTLYAFTIPSNVTPGTFTLQLNTDDNWGRTFQFNNQDYHFVIGLGSNSAPPVVTSVSPTSGTIGSNITITGTGFSSQVGLYFYSATRTITQNLTATSTNNGTRVVFTIPDWLYDGAYSFILGQPSGQSTTQYLTVTTTAPFITSITPASGPAGSIVTITGGNFSGSNSVSYNSPYDASGSENYLPSGNGGTTIQFITPVSWQPGIHNIAVGTLNGYSSYKTFDVTSTGQQHSEGTNVLAPNGVVYRIMGNGRNPYTSAGAFTSYKFNRFATVVPANSFDLALPVGTYTPSGSNTAVPYYIPPRNGALINDKGTVYIITSGLRAGFASEKIFKDLGYSFSNVYPGDTSFMVTMSPISSAAQKHMNGTLINDNGTLYVMKNGYRVGIPSMAVLDSWGYWASDAVTANSYDRAAEISEVMSTRLNNQMNL